MWLSSRGRQSREEDERDAQLGEVTVAGQETAVFLSGERRNIKTVAPGGYHWQPRERDTVLVVKTDGEEGGVLLGKEQARPDWLEKGSVWISADGGRGLLLKSDGSVHLSGMIYCNGSLLSRPRDDDDEEGGGA